MSEHKLKPCPFCGSPAKLEELGDHHGSYYNLGCSNEKCPAHSMFYTWTEEEGSVEDAIAMWDRRDDTAVKKLVEACLKGIAAVRTLINSSHGVAGLHLNGDLATWAELEEGGQFEAWLTDFNKAEQTLANVEGL